MYSIASLYKVPLDPMLMIRTCARLEALRDRALQPTIQPYIPVNVVPSTTDESMCPLISLMSGKAEVPAVHIHVAAEFTGTDSQF